MFFTLCKMIYIENSKTQKMDLSWVLTGRVINSTIYELRFKAHPSAKYFYLMLLLKVITMFIKGYPSIINLVDIHVINYTE